MALFQSVDPNTGGRARVQAAAVTLRGERGQRGATASANLYSLIETIKANGCEPYRYLCWLFERLPLTAASDMATLAPCNVPVPPLMGQRHDGRDVAVLAERKRVYAEARRRTRRVGVMTRVPGPAQARCG